MLEDHAAAIEKWKADCVRLREQGVLVKNLPKKPKRPLKPRLPCANKAGIEHEDERCGVPDESDVEMEDADSESSDESEDEAMSDDA